MKPKNIVQLDLKKLKYKLKQIFKLNELDAKSDCFSIVTPLFITNYFHDRKN